MGNPKNERVPVPIRWGAIFSDDIIAAATIDRLVHHAHVIITEGNSLRLSDAVAGRGVMPLT